MKKSTHKVRRRLDFVVKPIVIDGSKGIIGLKFLPNPKRYDYFDGKDGEKFLYDKLDDVYIPIEALKELEKELGTLPIYHQPQQIKNADEYVSGRIPEIQKMLKIKKIKPTFGDKSEEFLESLKEDELGFAIMSLDLVGSTKLSQKLKKDFAKLIEVFTYEMSSVIPKFHGHVLKYLGDGLIAYFPEPSFITKCDLALDCALTLRKLTYDGLNPEFVKFGLEKVDIRIGLEAGEASILVLGNPETKQHKDLIGEVINIATKIQSKAKVGGVFIGETMVRNLHTDWRSHCEEVTMNGSWPYQDENGNPYKIYEFV